MRCLDLNEVSESSDEEQQTDRSELKITDSDFDMRSDIQPGRKVLVSECIDCLLIHHVLLDSVRHWVCFDCGLKDVSDWTLCNKRATNRCDFKLNAFASTISALVSEIRSLCSALVKRKNVVDFESMTEEKCLRMSRLTRSQVKEISTETDSHFAKYSDREND